MQRSPDRICELRDGPSVLWISLEEGRIAGAAACGRQQEGRGQTPVDSPLIHYK